MGAANAAAAVKKAGQAVASPPNFDGTIGGHSSRIADGQAWMSDSPTQAEMMAYQIRQRGFGPDWQMTSVAERAVKPGLDDDSDPISRNYRNEMDRSSDAKKTTLVDNTKRVYTLDNLAAMPTWKIQGAGDPELASAMTKLQGEREKMTGEWMPYDREKTDGVLATVARVRGIDQAKASADYRTALQIIDERETAGYEAGQKRVAYKELDEKNEHRVPLLSMSAANGLPDNSSHMASIEQLRFGKMVGDALGGLDPVFGALLSPTGGIPGAGNVRVTSSVALAAAGGTEVVTNHGFAHDAAGYLLNYQGIGPGYQYVPNCTEQFGIAFLHQESAGRSSPRADALQQRAPVWHANRTAKVSTCPPSIGARACCF